MAYSHITDIDLLMNIANGERGAQVHARHVKEFWINAAEELAGRRGVHNRFVGAKDRLLQTWTGTADSPAFAAAAERDAASIKASHDIITGSGVFAAAGDLETNLLEDVGAVQKAHDRYKELEIEKANAERAMAALDSAHVGELGPSAFPPRSPAELQRMMDEQVIIAQNALTTLGNRYTLAANAVSKASSGHLWVGPKASSASGTDSGPASVAATPTSATGTATDPGSATDTGAAPSTETGADSSSTGGGPSSTGANPQTGTGGGGGGSSLSGGLGGDTGTGLLPRPVPETSIPIRPPVSDVGTVPPFTGIGRNADTGLGLNRQNPLDRQPATGLGGRPVGTGTGSSLGGGGLYTPSTVSDAGRGKLSTVGTNGQGDQQIQQAARPQATTTAAGTGQAPTLPRGGATGAAGAPVGGMGAPPPMMPPMAPTGAGGAAGRSGAAASKSGTVGRARPGGPPPGVPAGLRGRTGKTDPHGSFGSPQPPRDRRPRSVSRAISCKPWRCSTRRCGPSRERRLRSSAEHTERRENQYARAPSAQSEGPGRSVLPAARQCMVRRRRSAASPRPASGRCPGAAERPGRRAVAPAGRRRSQEP